MSHNRSAVSGRVVESVARSKGVDPTALPPLLDAVDPDALDALFARQANGDGQPVGVGTVEFDYAGKRVMVDASGSVHVR